MSSNKQITLNLSHGFLAVIFIAVAIVLGTIALFSNPILKTLHMSVDKSQAVESKVDSMRSIIVASNQFLLSSLDYATERQRLILFSRDVILASKGSLATQEEAFRIAQANVREAEMYSNLDPLLILAQQWQETGGKFNYKAVNEKSGARGLMQVMPETAVDLWDGFFKNKYDEVLLSDIDINVKIGCKYIANRVSVFKDYGTALAYYNGGKIAADMYRNKDPNLYAETAKYVPDVLSRWQNYREALKDYKINKELLVDQRKIKGN